MINDQRHARTPQEQSQAAVLGMLGLICIIYCHMINSHPDIVKIVKLRNYNNNSHH